MAFQSEVMDSVKKRLEGEKNVLEAVLKSGNSERKRKRIAEIDERTAELIKETFTGIGKIISEPEDKKILLKEKGKASEEENGLAEEELQEELMRKEDNYKTDLTFFNRKKNRSYF